MKFLFVVTTLCFAMNAHASDLSIATSPAFAKFCSEGVGGDGGHWIFNRPQIAENGQNIFVTKRLSENGTWQLESISDSGATRIIAVFNHEIRDIKFASPFLWVATANKLTAINTLNGKTEKEIVTAEMPADYPQHNQIGEFAIQGNRAFVAQGMKGIIEVDLKTGSVVQSSTLGLDHQAGGHVSKVVGLATSGSELVAIIDSVTMPTDNSKAFNGIIRVNSQDLSVLSRSPSDETLPMTEVMNSQVIGQTLLVNNWGILEKIDLSSLRDGHKFKAASGSIKTVYQGTAYSTETLGDLLTDGQQVFGCGVIANDDNAHQIVHRTGVVVRAQLGR